MVARQFLKKIKDRKNGSSSMEEAKMENNGKIKAVLHKKITFKRTMKSPVKESPFIS